MNRKEVFQVIISTMQRELPFPVIERDVKLPIDSGQMITVAGVRRCGKSSMLKLVANQLVNAGVDRRRILWVNFDDERLDGMGADGLDDIIKGYREMFPEIDLSTVYIFFDEIQNIEGWELFVMRLYKSYCKNIYLSGSNAKMLSSQIATALRGWPIEYEAFPLSFSEYLRFKNVEASVFDEAGRARLVNMVRAYIHSSSFPEIVLMNEESLKIRKVQGYFNTMLFRDLVEHYKLPNSEVVRYALKRIMLNVTKPTSINAIFNELKSQGRKIDKNRLYDLADMACDIFMLHKVNRWSKSFVNETGSFPKYYIADNGLRSAVILPQSQDDGKLLENAVYLHLRRHISPMHKITYFNAGYECDFVVQRDERIDCVIQVCWTLSDPETRERELRGLKAASDATGCSECRRVTFDEEETIDYRGIGVHVVAAWRWLLAKPLPEEG